MAVINALNGKVTSWASNTAILSSFLGEASLTFNMQGSAADSTVFGSSGVIATSSLPTPRAYSVDISGYFPNSPANGTSGSVTFASGYVLHSRAFNVDIQWAEYDVTEFDGTGITDRLWIPGLASWSGSYTCYLDGTTAMSDITSGTGSAAAATFKIIENGASNDDTLAGSIITTGATLGMSPTGLPTITYQFTGSGQLTANAGGTNIGANSNGVFDDSAGTLLTPTEGELIWQTAASRTVTANAFPTRLSFGCSVDGINTLDVTGRISGGITIA